MKRSGESAEPVGKRLRTEGASEALSSVQEKDVGMTRYINKQHGGFAGLIKQRYSDFQVHEISADGSVVYLRQAGLPAGAEELLSGKKKPEKETLEKEEVSIPEETRKELLELVTSDEIEAMLSIFHTGDKVTTQTAISSKDDRRKFHHLVTKAFGGKLETMTAENHTFQIAKRTNQSRKQSGRHIVDENGVVNFGLGPFKKYTHFTLYKENRETMEVASRMAKFLKVPNGRIQYAGTKDRRGVTCQRMCVAKTDVPRLHLLSKGLPSCTLGDYAYEDRGLELGGCKGNQFTIAIRDVQLVGANGDAESSGNLEQLVATAAESLRQNGYINYFGLQRFGTYSVSTHVIGKEHLRLNWRKAAELLLSDQERVLPESKEARKVWEETHDASQALPLMPARCFAEHAILNQLAKSKKTEDGYETNAYFTGIMKIPKNLRLIYVHAYQLYVWNVMASKRIELYGLSVQEGDLVMVELKNPGSKVVSEVVDGEEFLEEVAGLLSDKVRPLSQEEAESGKYTIFDIVLPSPGYDVQYPANERLMEEYRHVMAEDGFDPHNMARRVQEFLMAGSYRPLMQKPLHLEYQFVKYASDSDDIVLTDKQMLERSLDPARDARVSATSADLPKTAIVLTMLLPLSCYATMALREFMKVDTNRYGGFVGLKQ